MANINFATDEDKNAIEAIVIMLKTLSLATGALNHVSLVWILGSKQQC